MIAFQPAATFVHPLMAKSGCGIFRTWPFCRAMSASKCREDIAVILFATGCFWCKAVIPPGAIN
jgi:hypothetical protein